MPKQKYDINDPRNPDCPCHKQQKQAEEEFRRLKNVKDLSFEGKSSSQNIRIKINADNNQGAKKSGFYLSKRNRKKSCVNRLRFRLSQKARSIKKARPDYSVCYKW